MNWVFGAGLILLALAAAADFLGGRVMRAGPLYLLGAAGAGCGGNCWNCGCGEGCGGGALT